MKMLFLTLVVALMPIPAMAAPKKATEDHPDDTPEIITAKSLIDMLADDEPYVRHYAAVKLGEIRDKRAMAPLIKAFEDENKYVSRAATWTIAKYGDAAVEPLIKELKNENGSVRTHAAWALGRLKVKKAIKPILESVKNDEELEDEDLYTVAWALGSIGDAALDSLLEKIDGGGPQVREISILALGWIENEKARKTLVKLLYGDNRRDGDFAAQALGWQGDEALDDILAAAKHEDSDVRVAAARALGLLYGECAVKPLITLLGDPDREVRATAAYSLAPLGHEDAIDPLINALEDADPLVRARAAWALSSKPDKKALEPLLSLLDDRDPQVRKWAAWTVAAIKDERAVVPLFALLED